jgi:hypothetical protein
VGSWEEKLTFLDYSIGKTFTVLANINMGLTPNKKGYILRYEYPKEPQANSKDAIYAANYLAKTNWPLLKGGWRGLSFHHRNRGKSRK